MPELARTRQAESRLRARDQPVLRPCGEKRLHLGEEIDTVFFREKRRIEIAVLDLVTDLALHAVCIRLLAHELEGLRSLLDHLLIRRECTVIAPHHLTDEAARARAEGEDVTAALGERIVDAALTVIRRPVGCVDAAHHRVLHDDVNAAPEILRLLLRRRQHRQITRCDAPCQFARREHIELIEVAARDADLELRAHIVFPDLHRLVGQPVDEVGDDDGALLLHHAAQCRDDRFAVVNASNRLTDARVKGLHAEGEPIDARVHCRLNLALREIMDAPLKRDLAVTRERQTCTHRLYEARDIRIAQRCRRTAAEEHRLKGCALHVGRIRCRIQLIEEHIDVVMRRFFPREVLKKSAVAAFFVTERNMDVNRSLVGRIRRLCHQIRPDTCLLLLVHHHALAACTGVYHTLFGKGTAEWVLRLRSKQPRTFLDGKCVDFLLQCTHANTSLAAAITRAKSAASG